MKKRLNTFIILLTCISNVAICQNSLKWRFDSLRSIAAYNEKIYYDSLVRHLTEASDEREKVDWMIGLADHFKFRRQDSTIYYAFQALNLARKIGYERGEIWAAGNQVIFYESIGNYSMALKICLELQKKLEKSGDIYSFEKAALLIHLGIINAHYKSFRNALKAFSQSEEMSMKLGQYDFAYWSQYYKATTYLSMGLLDSAYYHCHNAHVKSTGIWVSQFTALGLGHIEEARGNTLEAKKYYHQLIENEQTETSNLFQGIFSIAELHRKSNQYDSSLLYAKESFKIAEQSGFYPDIVRSAALLSNLLEVKDPVQALLYDRHVIAYQDSIHNLEKNDAFESIIDFDAQEREREIAEAKAEYESRLRTNIFVGSSVTLLAIVILLYWNNRQNQKSKRKIEVAYERLKNTQSQLIQSEKMASLGELTAGIAHEIQNPLNFVNNFSEVSTELVDEMNEELEKGNTEDAKQIASDLKQNLEKINHHGKRAGDIVKGMLQHSRSSSGVKEPTDINALADEYLRLAYHGLRAKDKSFNATINTDYDQTIGNINIIPQDVGRVILNLINNAFYAVNERQKLMAANNELPANYEPTVSVSTKKEGNKVLISVKDNGNGIPQKILDKIFQPFFTTKPTGQGTGLGLSLSYDIVKAHGGELSVKTPSEKVETIEGEGSEFVILFFNNIS